MGAGVDEDDRTTARLHGGGRIARVVDRALFAAYERLGARYLSAVVAFTLVGLAVNLAFVVAIGIPHFPDGLTPFRLFAHGAGGYIGVAVVVLRFRRTFATVAEWWRHGRPAVGADEVWTAASRFAARFTIEAFIAGFAFGLLSLAWLGADLRLGMKATLATMVGGFVLSVLGWVWTYAFCDISVRPLLVDAAARMPSSFRPPERYGVAYRTKVFRLFVGVGLSVSGVGVVIGSGSEPLEDVLGATLVAVAVSLVITLGLTIAVGRSLQAPIEDLIDLTGKVGAGDLTAHAPVASDDELGALTAAFNQMVDDLRRSDSATRAAQVRTVAAADEARRKVERDLHDGAQQHLVLAQLKLGLLEKAIAEGADAADLTTDLRSELASALRALRDLARGIYPAVLESDGLVGALTEFAQRSSVPVTLDCDSVGRHPRELETAVYFCCLEALQNAAKHAGPGAQVSVRLERCDEALRFEVSDDGLGFDLSSTSGLGGLQHVVDRLGALGGDVDVRSAVGSGTTIIGSLPLPSRAPRVDAAGPADARSQRTEHALGRATSTSLRTVIVDDHPGFRNFARELCTAAGFDVVGEAADGSSALAVVAELRPDVVLLDVQLPDVDGFEVADRLAARSDAPVVVLTSTRSAAELGGRLTACPTLGFISKQELSADRLVALFAEER